MDDLGVDKVRLRLLLLHVVDLLRLVLLGQDVHVLRRLCVLLDDLMGGDVWLIVHVVLGEHLRMMALLLILLVHAV